MLIKIKKIKILLPFLVNANFLICQQNCIVSHKPTGHRLGDNLLSFSHALWISYKFKIPIKYTEFEYSNMLKISDLAKFKKLKYKKKILQFNQIIEQFINKNDKNIEYIIPYFPQSKIEFLNPKPPTNDCIFYLWQFPYFAVDWKDLGFKNQLTKYISLKNYIELVVPPKNHHSIAVHIRKYSGGVDYPLLDEETKKGKLLNTSQRYNDVIFPWKFPAEEFYIKWIKAIINLLDGKKYVFIFTDHNNPQELINELKNSFKNDEILWDFRDDKNKDTKYVLNDLFSFRNFDFLIRSSSNFSFIGEIIGEYRATISPDDHIWIDNRLIITKAKINGYDLELINKLNSYNHNK
jgi:hypothetical protein